MHNLSAEAARSNEIKKDDARTLSIIKELWCRNYFRRNTPIYCGIWAVLINAQFLGKHVVAMEKWTEFGGKGDLMHRFIHGNWGEGSVNKLLDLSI